MLMSKGSLEIFFHGKLVTTLVILSAALLIVPYILQAIAARRRATAAD
jgi:TctA family transporter